MTVLHLSLHKSKELTISYKICYSKRQCDKVYARETIRNTTMRWSEHNPTHKSEPAEHIKTY